MNQRGLFSSDAHQETAPLPPSAKNRICRSPLQGSQPGAAERRQNRRAIQSKWIPVQAISLRAIPPSSHAIRALAEVPAIITTAPLISFEIRNTDTRSGDYKGLRAVPRPGHADYTARLRYGNTLNMAGGGPFSARMTAPLCIAGGIALQMLKEKNIEIGAHLYAIAGIEDTPLDPVSVSAETLVKLQKMEFPVLSETAGEKNGASHLAGQKRPGFRGRHRRSVCDRTARRHRRSYVRWSGKLPGTDLLRHTGRKRRRIRRRISRSRASRLRKQRSFLLRQSRAGKTRTNYHGGILGGITTGMPLLARLAFKPTPSISRKQDSVDLEAHKNETLVVKGRHDPCVAVRAVPITEAALALGILDCIMEVTK